MSQDAIDLETSLGYLLKEASSALRAAMEAVLRPLGMSVTHYSCLELLAQRPGLSNSELARGAFVTRQSMNVLLQALERDGFVTRPVEAPVGKALPARLTPRGRRSLATASAAVRSVELRMLGGMSPAEQADAFAALQGMTRSLREGGTDVRRPERPEVVCLCGSARFADELRTANRDLSLTGAIVVAPGQVDETISEEQRAALGELHLRRIDLADRVLVVNPGGYVGESTSREVAYARSTGKPVSFTDPA